MFLHKAAALKRLGVAAPSGLAWGRAGTRRAFGAGPRGRSPGDDAVRAAGLSRERWTGVGATPMQQINSAHSTAAAALEALSQAPAPDANRGDKESFWRHIDPAQTSARERDVGVPVVHQQPACHEWKELQPLGKPSSMSEKRRKQHFLEKERMRKARALALENIKAIRGDKKSLGEETTNTGAMLDNINQWFLALSTELKHKTARVDDYLAKKAQGKRPTKPQASVFGMAPYLALLPADLMAIIVIQETLASVLVYPSGVVVTPLALRIGQAVYDEVKFLRLIARGRGDPFPTGYFTSDSGQGSVTGDSAEEDLAERFGLSKPWPTSLVLQIGAALLSNMLDHCFVLSSDNSVKSPAFVKQKVMGKSHSHFVISLNEALFDRLISEQSTLAFVRGFVPLSQPMIVPPKPWRSFGKGPFLATYEPMVRDVAPARSNVRDRINLAFPNMGVLVDALNKVGSQPWVLNHEVITYAEQVAKNDSGQAGLPKLSDLRAVREEGELCRKLLAKNSVAIAEANQDNTQLSDDDDESKGAQMGMEDTDSADRQRKGETVVLLKRKQIGLEEDLSFWVRREQEIKSKHLDFNAKLDLAAFGKEHGEPLYFPHSIDFRGRAYPIAPVSHMGDDLARAFLKFGEKRRLGKSGLRWLKIHLANQMGKDKAELNERVAWVDKHQAEFQEAITCIREVGIHNTSDLIWEQAENPWQAIATMIELHNAWECADGPEEYCTAMPVHQDGSCNGLQHYAALGRDLEGARAVNLVPAEKPADVYMAVADKLVARLEEWTKSDVTPVPVKEKIKPGSLQDGHKVHLANVILEHVSRKLVKQTVMTTVYGVTFIGAREQIFGQLETINERNGDFMTREELSTMAGFLAKETIDSVGSTFKSATKVKSWLKDMAKISLKFDQEVSWVTPLGLPAVQPYYKPESSRVYTALDRVRILEYSSDSKINKSKQATAFPPNFVHALDSSHMLLTAKRCFEEGLNFAAVHDSFWTHPSDVDRMNAILRDAFVELHSKDILGDFAAQLRLRFPDANIRDPPKQGSLDINCVRESTYFFA